MTNWMRKAATGAMAVTMLAGGAMAGERHDDRRNYQNSYSAPSYSRYDYRDYRDYRHDRHERYRDRYDRRSTGESAAIIGGGAGVGAVIGALAGGGKGAAIGALVGGVGGVVVDQATKDHHDDRYRNGYYGRRR